MGIMSSLGSLYFFIRFSLLFEIFPLKKEKIEALLLRFSVCGACHVPGIGQALLLWSIKVFLIVCWAVKKTQTTDWVA